MIDRNTKHTLDEGGKVRSLSERARSLRGKLDRLTQCDSQKRIFGAKEPFGHGYVRHPCLTAPQMSQLEASFGVELPDELRVLLSEVLGGGAGPGYGLSVAADAVLLARRARPFPFSEELAQRVIAARISRSDPRASLDMPDDNAPDDDDWPPGPGFIPIAHHGCGVFDVVVTTGPQRGLTWWCDMTWCPYFDANGKPLGVLDWYEVWLDRSLAELRRSPS